MSERKQAAEVRVEVLIPGDPPRIVNVLAETAEAFRLAGDALAAIAQEAQR